CQSNWIISLFVSSFLWPAVIDRRYSSSTATRTLLLCVQVKPAAGGLFQEIAADRLAVLVDGPLEAAWTCVWRHEGTAEQSLFNIEASGESSGRIAGQEVAGQERHRDAGCAFFAAGDPFCSLKVEDGFLCGERSLVTVASKR